MPIILPIHVRMARAALGIGVRELAEMSGITANTINRFEIGRTGGNAHTVRQIQAALEAAGIEFLNGDAPGVRLRKPRSAEPST